MSLFIVCPSDFVSELVLTAITSGVFVYVLVSWLLFPFSQLTLLLPPSLQASGKLCFAHRFILNFIYFMSILVCVYVCKCVRVCVWLPAPNIHVLHVLPNNFWYLLPTNMLFYPLCSILLSYSFNLSFHLLWNSLHRTRPFPVLNQLFPPFP